MSGKLVQLAGLLPLVFALGACGQGRAESEAAKDVATTIVVGPDVNHSTVHSFARAHGRYPTREELLEIHRVWLDNEILYREGLKAHPGAAAAKSREQVIFEALAVIDAKVRTSAAPEVELRRWFDEHLSQYEQLARFDFEDASPPGHGSEAEVKALVAKLNAGAVDVSANLRTFRSRPESNLVQSYGPEVARALSGAEPGQWLALRSRDGWRALRLSAFVPAQAARFEQQREQVRRDWIEATAAPKRDAAVRALWKNYQIELSQALDCLADK